MDSSIIISLILGFASIVSSICYGLVPGIRKNKLEKLEKKVNVLAQDIDSFYAIEQKLLEQLSTSTNRNFLTLKKEIRKEVEKEKGRCMSNYSKPSEIARILKFD